MIAKLVNITPNYLCFMTLMILVYHCIHIHRVINQQTSIGVAHVVGGSFPGLMSGLGVEQPFRYCEMLGLHQNKYCTKLCESLRSLVRSGARYVFIA